jgi:hypothetical protein
MVARRAVDELVEHELLPRLLDSHQPSGAPLSRS